MIVVLFLFLVIVPNHSYAKQSSVGITRNLVTKSGVFIKIHLNVEKIEKLKPCEASVKIVDKTGAPVPDALIYCSLYMPNFATGSNRPSFKPSDEEGTYKSVMFFNESGGWLASFTVNLPEGEFEQVEVPFTVTQ